MRFTAGRPESRPPFKFSLRQPAAMLPATLPGGMERMRAILSTFWRDCSAATAIEYAMVAFLVSIAGFVTYSSIGSGVTGLFQSVANGF
jgi:Flp pilus assembly pilin Flp